MAMTQREFKTYKKKWEGVKKEIFTALSKGEHEKAFNELEKVRLDMDFYKAPTVPEDQMIQPGSPINELLLLLAHKKIFFTLPKPTEIFISEFKANNQIELNDEQKKFISDVDNAVINEKMKRILEIASQGEPPEDFPPINIPDLIPHFPVERMDAIPFIEKLIELGADTEAIINNKDPFYKKLLSVDSEILTKYVLSKVSDEKLLAIDSSGGDYLCHTLKSRATNSFFTIVKEKEKIIDFSKKYILLNEQNLLHLSMGNYLPLETYFLISKKTSFIQKGIRGLYPADLIPNNEIAEALEGTKAAIREDSLCLNSTVSMFVPKGFKPYPQISVQPDEFYEEMVNATKKTLEDKRAESLKNISKYRTEF